MKNRLCILLAFAFSCQGDLVLPTSDVGDMGQVAADVTSAPDLAPIDLGIGPDPLCVGVTCMPNAECGRGLCWCSPGYMGDPSAGCAPGNPCTGVTCQFGSTCNDSGQCPCDPGFEDDGVGGCTATVDDFPLERTEADVCARWLAEYPETAGVQWQTSPVDECDPGELDPVFQLDAVRRLTLYRWLSGLPGVASYSEYMSLTQACATALDAENIGATHDIATTFSCYSENAATGASASSIVRGVATPAASVDRYMEDAGAPTLGNRRWILNPELGRTAFGQRGAYSCMYAIDLSGSSNPQYVAYPFGVFPSQALRGRWMWSSAQLFTNEQTSVSVLDGGGAAIPVSNLTLLGGGTVPAAIAWEVGVVPPGQYTVTISELDGVLNELSYPVNIVDCQ